MARNKTLGSLLTDFRAETRRSANPAHNNQMRDTDVTLLQRMQEWLHEDFDWPHMVIERDIALQAGSRYYSAPEDIDISRVIDIHLKDGDVWRCLKPGITTYDLNVYDSDLDERAWPVARWQIAEDTQGDLEQIEVWPIPDVNGDPITKDAYIRVRGIKKLPTLVSDDDRCALDARLIVLYAAAEYLAGSGAKDANLKLSQAKQLDLKLRGGMSKRRRFKMFGIGEPDQKKLLKGPPTVYYRTDN